MRTVAVAVFELTVVEPNVAKAVARFTIDLSIIFEAVTAYVAVQVVDAPGASVLAALEQLTLGSLSSVMPYGAVNVTLPEFVNV